jgi:phospholipase/carboxylesterase
MTDDAPAIDRFELSGPRPPRGEGTVVVLLHGRGSDEHDLQGLRRRLLPDSWTLVTPRATYAGQPWGYGPGWAWYRYVAEDRVEPETLPRSLDRARRLHRGAAGARRWAGGAAGARRLLAGRHDEPGLRALQGPGKVVAALNFSGFLADGVEVPDAESVPPLFWGHGLHDPAIPHALAVRGRARLAERGIEPTVSDHPIGHGIVPEEVEVAVQVVEEAIAAQRRGLSRPPHPASPVADVSRVSGELHVAETVQGTPPAPVPLTRTEPSQYRNARSSSWSSSTGSMARSTPRSGTTSRHPDG